jgi:ABC-2 type transport system permease protein
LKGDEYEVSLTVRARKMYADEKGNEAEATSTNDYIDIGIFAEDKVEKNGRKLTQPLYLKKHRFKNGEFTLQFKVKGKPVKAGIDPYNQLIDRIPEDNKINVDIK